MGNDIVEISPMNVSVKNVENIYKVGKRCEKWQRLPERVCDMKSFHAKKFVDSCYRKIHKDW